MEIIIRWHTCDVVGRTYLRMLSHVIECYSRNSELQIVTKIFQHEFGINNLQLVILEIHDRITD